jgi:serine/threonine-protein kinase
MTSAGEIRSADPLLGQVIDGRFKVEALLGAGSVGSVYRAFDRTQGKPVALKIWNATSYNEQTRGRFLREAKALSTLRHPNIVDVHSYGIIGVLPYVALEYLDGSSLESQLSNGQPLDPALAMHVLTQVLQALAYAHGLGVVHRDLKPDNVVLVTGERGQPVVKLLDYGLAKFLSADDDPMHGSALTMTGMIMGTPLYMAPEQAAGKTVDARVDVYAAGCLLFEMLSGRPPYAGESNAEVFRAHMSAEIPDLASLLPEAWVAPELQGLIEQALAKRPEQRFAHAGQMLEALLALPRPPVRPKTAAPPRLRVAPPENDVAAAAPQPRRSNLPLVAALITGLCTAAALAYALLR